MRKRRLLWLVLAVPFLIEWWDERAARRRGEGPLPEWVRSL